MKKFKDKVSQLFDKIWDKLFWLSLIIRLNAKSLWIRLNWWRYRDIVITTLQDIEEKNLNWDSED